MRDFDALDEQMFSIEMDDMDMLIDCVYCICPLLSLPVFSSVTVPSLSEFGRKNQSPSTVKPLLHPAPIYSTLSILNRSILSHSQ